MQRIIDYITLNCIKKGCDVMNSEEEWTCTWFKGETRNAERYAMQGDGETGKSIGSEQFSI